MTVFYQQFISILIDCINCLLQYKWTVFYKVLPLNQLVAWERELQALCRVYKCPS